MHSFLPDDKNTILQTEKSLPAFVPKHIVMLRDVAFVVYCRFSLMVTYTRATYLAS